MKKADKIGDNESPRQQSTADPRFSDAKKLYSDTRGVLFKRRGAWFALFIRGNGYGMAGLRLGTLRGAKARARDGRQLVDIYRLTKAARSRL
jgi:hypothetical protein